MFDLFEKSVIQKYSTFAALPDWGQVKFLGGNSSNSRLLIKKVNYRTRVNDQKVSEALNLIGNCSKKSN